MLPAELALPAPSRMQRMRARDLVDNSALELAKHLHETLPLPPSELVEARAKLAHLRADRIGLEATATAEIVAAVQRGDGLVRPELKAAEGAVREITGRINGERRRQAALDRVYREQTLIPAVKAAAAAVRQALLPNVTILADVVRRIAVPRAPELKCDVDRLAADIGLQLPADDTTARDAYRAARQEFEAASAGLYLLEKAARPDEQSEIVRRRAEIEAARCRRDQAFADEQRALGLHHAALPDPPQLDEIHVAHGHAEVAHDALKICWRAHRDLRLVWADNPTELKAAERLAYVLAAIARGNPA
jgi:hypothetical protein